MIPKSIKARCAQCGHSAIFTGRTLDEVRRIICPTCLTQGRQSRLTVYGVEGDQTPALGSGAPQMLAEERVVMSDAYRQIVNEKARRLLDGIVVGDQEVPHGGSTENR
jgi:hypothetical protein